jgi:hypothetical protein
MPPSSCLLVRGTYKLYNRYYLFQLCIACRTLSIKSKNEETNVIDD